MVAIERYGRNLLVLLDEAVNVVILWGNPHESISQHAAFSAREGRRWGCVLCRILDWVQKDHCANAILNVDRAGNQEA